MQQQWSGATVKYHFFSGVFKFGFITLWLLYLSQDRIISPRLLTFIIPSLLLLFSAVVLRGRRGEMMNLVSYLFVSWWFVRRYSVPRWFIVSGLLLGLVLINGIGTYRSIMKNKEVSLEERLSLAANADYLASSKMIADKSGFEFKNYIFYRQVSAETGNFDYGCLHWNKLIFNYVPAQLLGGEFKESLMIEQLETESPRLLAKEMYGHAYRTGTTSTGYSDAFGSFGWLGFIKFLLIGWMMGTLYRHAIQGRFLGQLLYIYMLGTAMHAISHGTHRILFAVWVYFFVFVFPVLCWARLKRAEAWYPASPEGGHTQKRGLWIH